METEWNLDNPIIRFSAESELGNWSIRHATQGLVYLGGIGSGKTSSSKVFALNYLKNGFGGLVLSAKPEKEMWQEFCRLTNREDDLIILEPNGKYHFNFLDY